ncbi:AraC family transcriptional regulator [Rhodoplanes roseus]|uniref:HTH araC/xylS-type domain-containing protein n=1 Tax=Rhodoplanes roseus TaxID=29409 RepID=A0A327KV23_9BRAD|nr:AraC family transcriptional regulator [Rhodoplanes roseus]RAI41824.1 hypothetical protein CH341_20885 [Rhodoplanes roseus]
MLDRFHLFSATHLDEHRALARTFIPEITRIEQIDPGLFRSEIAVFSFGTTAESSRVGSISHTTALAAEIQRREPVRVLVPTTSTVVAALGSRLREIAGGGLAGLLPCEALRIRYSAGHHMSICVERAPLAAAMSLFDCDGPIDPILSELFFEPRIRGLQSWAEHLRRLVAELDDSPRPIIDLPAFRSAHEQLLVLRLADVLVAAVDADHRPRIVRDNGALRRAEEYIRAHAERPVDLAAMSRHAGLSLRSLQNLFRANHDCTIVQYVRRYRLALARSRLEHGDPETSVAEIARASGFTHLGHFTAAYKAVFGEQPRQTRQRTRRKPMP